ncbi:FlgD immunoglobulin-like domain containing protein, partial [Pirellulales bacterium]|nr:FlgD immunoglobulin-like domain containing protein [Pirellulales bacterium]
MPNTAFVVELFATESPGAESREGENYLHTFSVTTDGNGNASFDETLSVTLSSEQFVTATATGPSGNTSEFSAGRRPEALFTTVAMPFDGTLSVAIYDETGQLVRILREASPELAGSVAMGWDGRDDFGRVLPAGEYEWRAVYSQAQAVDDGQVGDLADQPYGLTEHSNTVSAVAVDSAGNVYEASPYEEFHLELRKWDADGNAVWGFEFAGGEKAIAANDTYVYGARVAAGENRIERFLASDGSPAPWSSPASGSIVVNTSADPNYAGGIFGLGVDSSRLWVGNDEQDRVEIYDVATGAFLHQFATNDPKGVVADGQGNAWVAHSGSTVTLFDSAGVVQSEIAGLNQPFALALGAPSDATSGDNLYIGEVGSGQVHEYDLDPGTPALVRSLFGGAEPGPVADDKFYWPITERAGLAVDSAGRMIISDDGNKRVLTFNADGTLLRTRFSEFQPAPFTDPTVDPNMLLSTSLQYDVNYATGDWMLSHNWRPADNEFYSAQAVRRTLSNGQDYLFFLDARGEQGDQLVTVVYALESTGMRRSAIIGSDPTGLWNWTDADGDGEVEELEKTFYNDATAADFRLFAPGAWVDGDGNAWIGHWNETVPGVGNVGNTVKVAMEGFDAHGNPIFNWANRQTAIAADTSEWQFDTNNVRVHPATGETFLIGTTAKNDELGPFYMGGTAVDRRAADGSRISVLPISGPEGQAQVIGSGQYMVAIATGTDADYFYTGHAAFDQHWVRMYTTDGMLITTGFIGPDNGSHGGWIDHGMGITAFTDPASGVHYVYAEEVLYGKSIRYRIDGLETVGRTQQGFDWVAEPFHVINTMDDGDGSLRRAIENANA